MFHVTVEPQDGGSHTWRTRTGFRDLAARGTQFTVNGRPVFLRGTLECQVFPLTGYPPCDVPSWQRIYRTIKGYGLNHMRFHSWCPPEAAFAANSVRIGGAGCQTARPPVASGAPIRLADTPQGYAILPS